MKAGDKWNWALATSSIIVAGFQFLMPMRRMQLNAMGEGAHKPAYGITWVFTPFVLAPVLLVAAGIISSGRPGSATALAYSFKSDYSARGRRPV